MTTKTIFDNMQTAEAATVLMVPPEGFGFNAQTAESNAFQEQSNDPNVSALAMQEFNNMVAALAENGVQVLVMPQDASLPDAVFPNNWFSTHLSDDNKTNIVLYPMLTPNRRAEVNKAGLLAVLADAKVNVGEVVDLSQASDILEGTGSFVLDRQEGMMYAAISERTERAMVETVAEKLDYFPVIFHAADEHQQPIYHTNVIMGIAETFAVVCLDCIATDDEREEVKQYLEKSGKDVIAITQDQMTNMCGNVLAVRNKAGEKLLVMSMRAYDYFSQQQLAQIQTHCKILPISIETIETIGGGSVRCMMAEIYHQ